MRQSRNLYQTRTKEFKVKVMQGQVKALFTVHLVTPLCMPGHVPRKRFIFADFLTIPVTHYTGSCASPRAAVTDKALDS
jgi:hypothetical protein